MQTIIIEYLNNGLCTKRYKPKYSHWMKHFLLQEIAAAHHCTLTQAQADIYAQNHLAPVPPPVVWADNNNRNYDYRALRKARLAEGVILVMELIDLSYFSSSLILLWRRQRFSWSHLNESNFTVGVNHCTDTLFFETALFTIGVLWSSWGSSPRSVTV